MENYYLTLTLKESTIFTKTLGSFQTLESENLQSTVKFYLSQILNDIRF